MFVTGQALRGKVRNRQVECKESARESDNFSKGYRQYRMVPWETWVSENFTQSRNLGFEVFVMGLELFFGWLLGLGVLIFFWPKGLGGFFSFFFPLGLLESNFSEFTGTANRTGPVDWDRKTRQWRTIHLRRPKCRSLLFLAPFNEPKCLLLFEFLSKHFRPGPSSVELQVR